MNAKEKAYYLLKKFYQKSTSKNNAKELSKLAVEEILNALSFLKSDDISITYWNQVLKEIDLL